ncbi:MAG: DUF86 domain-containing protein [Alphaproteobacteria bacterium]|jgi:uncharacterized protein with HEPN domain
MTDTKQRIWQLYAEHIVKAADRIEQHRLKYEKSDPTVYEDALYRNLHTISESADKLPDFIKKEYPHIPWHKVKGFRNLIVHDYLGDEIDIKIVNDIVYNKIPELKEAAQEILKRYGEKETAGL